MTAVLLAGYAQAWAANSAQAIAAFWAPDRFRFYKAEEVTRPFTAWDEVVDYWRGNEAMHEAVKLGFSDVRPMPLEGGWLLAWCRMRWDIRFAAPRRRRSPAARWAARTMCWP